MLAPSLVRAALVAVLLVVGCTRVEVPTSPDRTGATAAPSAAPTVTDRIEFRVLGFNLLSPATIKYIDPVNGLTLTTSAPPFVVDVTSTAPSAFVYLEASAIGFSTGALQVQIMVNGRLFREGASVGGSLFASAGGTIQH